MTLQSSHRAMPLLTASKRPDTTGVQEYNGRDLVLLDPSQITLITAYQEVRGLASNFQAC